MVNQDFQEKLDALFKNNRVNEVEGFLREYHEKAVNEHDDSLLLTVLNEEIGYYRSISDQKASINSSQEMLELLEKIGAANTKEGGTSIINAATAYYYAGESDMAETLFKRAEKIYQEVLPPNDYLFVGLYNNMSAFYMALGNNAEAAAKVEKAIDILQDIPEEIEALAIVETNLAALYLKQKEYQKSEMWISQAAKLFDLYLPDNTHHGAVLSVQGALHAHMQNNTEAAACYEQAAREIKRFFGENKDYKRMKQNAAKLSLITGDTF